MRSFEHTTYLHHVRHSNNAVIKYQTSEHKTKMNIQNTSPKQQTNKQTNKQTKPTHQETNKQ